MEYVSTLGRVNTTFFGGNCTPTQGPRYVLEMKTCWMISLSPLSLHMMSMESVSEVGDSNSMFISTKLFICLDECGNVAPLGDREAEEGGCMVWKVESHAPLQGWYIDWH